jgi:hypothetical protein
LSGCTSSSADHQGLIVRPLVQAQQRRHPRLLLAAVTQPSQKRVAAVTQPSQKLVAALMQPSQEPVQVGAIAQWLLMST